MTDQTSKDAATSAPATQPAEAASASPAEAVIAAFGGIRPMAHKLGVPVTTVQGWKKRGSIPENRHAEIKAAAGKEGVALDDALLSAAGEAAPDAPAPAAAAERPPAESRSEPVPEPTPEPAPIPEPPPKPLGSDYNRPPDRHPPEIAAATPTSIVVQQRGGGVSWLALFVAVAAGAGLLSYHLWSDSVVRQPAPSAVMDRVAALEGRLAQIADAPAADLSALEARIAALEARPGTGYGAAVADLTARLGTLESRLGAVAASVPDPVDPDAVIAQARTVLQPDMAAAAATAAAPLTQRLDGLAADGQTRDQTLAALDNRLASLETARAALGDTRQALDHLSARLSDLEGTVSALDGRLTETAAVAERDRAAETRAQALILAVSQLREAAAGGDPFATALAAVQAAADGGDDLVQPLAVLTPLAAAGVPSRATLAADFPAMARSARAAVAVPRDAGWMDQALARLEGLVTVRPVAGEVEGGDLESVLARAEGRLMQDNLSGAVAALADLDGPAADAATGWIADAQARLALDEAVQALAGAAIARLGQSGAEAAARNGAGQ